MGELVTEFLKSSWFLYSMYIYLYLLVIYIVYSILNYFKYYSTMQDRIRQVYLNTSIAERKRADEERRKRDIHGEGNDKDILSRIDEILNYSGIKDKIPWLTTELFIVIALVFIAIVSTIVLLTFGLIQGLLSAVVIFAVIRLSIVLLSIYRSRLIDEQLLQFMNIIDNFSKTSNDIIDIFEKASLYIQDPLRNQIYQAVQKARNAGSKEIALKDLQDNVKNKHFKMLVRNLDTSSNFENNYSDIVEDCRGVFHSYIKSQKELKQIQISGMIQIGFLVVLSLVAIQMIVQIANSDDVIKVLVDSGTTGIGLILYLITAIILSIYIAIFKIIKAE